MKAIVRNRISLFFGLVLLLAGPPSFAGDEHWSRQFPIPSRQKPKMMPNVGMSGGAARPNIQRVQWQGGKLWMAGAWESGTPARNLSKTQMNEYWYLWTWSPVHGWEAVCYFHSAKGGSGPDGKLYDFLWLPDGRLVVAGSFARLDNPGGIMYHRVGALAIYDPKEPTANKWKPLGQSFQYQGNASGAGTIYSIAYDPQSERLYIGGNFGGLTDSPKVHYYDFKTQSVEPMKPGVRGGKASVRKLVVDTRTKPSTIYVAGDFFYTAGNGKQTAVSTSTSRISTGLAAWQEGKGWTTFPEKGVERRQDDHKLVLTAGQGHKNPKGTVLDLLLDGDDIWIVGGFGPGQKTGQNLAGIAKWDRAKQMWIDPTGKGGVGRECYSIAKADNGKIYFAGAFGGSKQGGFFDGFKNGDEAHCAISYDPKTGAWEQLGSGLGTITFPEVRMTVNGDDVYFVGDFQHIGAGRTGKGKTKKDDQPWESSYVARWNETVDFTKTPAEVAKTSTPTPGLYPQPTKTIFSGTEHWSRAFPRPTRRNPMSAKTGMGGFGTPTIYGMTKLGDSLYFVGSWEVNKQRWFSWRWHPEEGWKALSYKQGSEVVGPIGLMRGIKVHEGKLWVYGALSNFACVGTYDPESGSWSKLEGKGSNGETIVGNGMPSGGIIGDIAWDTKTGDLYMIGSHGVKDATRQSPSSVSQCLRVDKDGVYHTMGWTLLAQNLGKPVLHFSAIHIDEQATPSDIYIGGTFNYYGPRSHNSRMAYNVAKWDYEAKDWTRVGHGNTADVSPLDTKHYPNGLPGLKNVPPRGFLQPEFARVRVMTMDKDRNLYVGGTLAIRDSSLPVAKRVESFGLAKLERKTQRWVACTKVGGVSRDVFNMSWLDDARLLITGGFHYDEAWNPLNGIAIFDTQSGELTGVGGGGMRFHRSQTISSDVVHVVDGDDWYFAGLFEYVGINENSLVAAPIESGYVAHYNATKNFDPNRGLEVAAPPAIPRVTGYSSKMIEVKASAKLTEPGGTINWYLRKTNGEWDPKGTGPSFSTRVRIKATSPEPVIYVSVTRDGVEGGKLPIRVPFE